MKQFIKYITNPIGGILKKGQMRSTHNWRACMVRCMNVDEARGICKDHSRWRSVVSAYPHGRKEWVYIYVIYAKKTSAHHIVTLQHRVYHLAVILSSRVPYARKHKHKFLEYTRNRIYAFKLVFQKHLNSYNRTFSMKDSRVFRVAFLGFRTV